MTKQVVGICSSKKHLENLAVSKKHLESAGIKGNLKWICIPLEGETQLGLIKNVLQNRFSSGSAVADSECCIVCSQSRFKDFDFSPFDSNLLLTGSDDELVKLWKLSEDELGNLTAPVVALQGHGSRIAFCSFHPRDQQIVASTAFDCTCMAWDLEVPKAHFRIQFPSQAMDLKFSPGGSLLAITTKEKKLHILDTRQSRIAVTTQVCEGPAKGHRRSKATWMDDRYLVTTGMTMMPQRQVKIWDIRTMSDGDLGMCLDSLEIDEGQGALFPFFDPESHVLFLAGKGDANIRCMEVLNTQKLVEHVGSHESNVVQLGFDLLPRECTNLETEIRTGLKMKSNGIEMISFETVMSAAPIFDWPLSQSEKKLRLVDMYDRELEETNAQLEIQRAEHEQFRRSILPGGCEEYQELPEDGEDFGKWWNAFMRDVEEGVDFQNKRRLQVYRRGAEAAREPCEELYRRLRRKEYEVQELKRRLEEEL